MSGFTAINLEAEDRPEEEIDDTKEIQIEEALKLYQNALKLHSQGSPYYSAARDVYDELFQSEVFKYPEVISDYSHEQLDEAVSTGILPTEQEAVAIIPSNAADSAADSLPQLVYLAYKSRAQFVLDVAHHELSEASADRKALCRYYYNFCMQSLEDSAKALERDDSDLDLWKKAARISDVLASQRLARFCLESVLAGDDDAGDQSIDLSGLDEAFASGELQQVLQVVGDELSYTATTMAKPKPKLLQLLQASNDAYPFLPTRAAESEYVEEKHKPNTVAITRLTLTPASLSSLDIGEQLLSSLERYSSGKGDELAGLFVELILPISDVDESIDLNTIAGAAQESIVPSIATYSEPSAEVPRDDVDETPKSPASFHSAPDELRPDVDQMEDIGNEAIEVAKSSVVNNSGEAIEVHEEFEQTSDQVEALAEPEVKLLSRKRSSTAAGMDEHESRTKSKRLRARESMLELAAQEEETAVEVNLFDRELLAILDHNDRLAFDYVNQMLEKLGIQSFGSISALKKSIASETDSFSRPEDEPDIPNEETRMLMLDLRDSIFSWTDEHGSAIISGHGPRESLEKSNGLALFLRHLKTDIGREAPLAPTDPADNTSTDVLRMLSDSGSTLYTAIYAWLISLLASPSSHNSAQSSFLSERWSDALKHCVMDLVMRAESQIYEMVRLQAHSLLCGHDNLFEGIANLNQVQFANLVQSIFEIQLDIYNDHASSQADVTSPTDSYTFDCLQRWARLANDTIQSSDWDHSEDESADPILLRHVWATVKVVSLTASDDKTHVLTCLKDFRSLMIAAEEPTIFLPNSSTMPQISMPAAEQEMRRLATLDFFLSVFDTQVDDPLSLITKLEPLLEPDEASSTNSTVEDADDQNEQLRSFLDSGDAQLKLFLWRRLQHAYSTISYTPKVVSCLLRSFEVIVHDLRSLSHMSLESTARQVALLQWLHDIDDLITKVVSKITDDAKALEFLDEKHLGSSLGATIDGLIIFQGFICADDSIRVGQTQTPQLRANLQKMFEKSRERLRDTYVRLWTLLYYLIREASVQNPDCFGQPKDALSEYLSNIHNAIGQRQYCKNSNKLFVKLAKQELLSFRSGNEFSLDLAQILYDMYQIKFGVGIGDADHGCVPDLLRDKTTAMTLVPIIMAFASRLNVRDLVKSDLKITIDKIQQSLGSVRPSVALKFNKAAISSFLKAEVNPQAVYRSMNGVGDLITKPVDGDHARVAATGWYMLLGKMTLARFKSVKRINPTATDDLDTAATLLRNDLEHSIANWETWYRLAQVFDAKIEDSLIWNAAKLNDSRADIVILERNAINSYTMAIAIAMRSASDDPETIQNISDMFSEFGFRLFASSRPPLDMAAFRTDKSVRHISSIQDRSMSQAPFIQPFRPYAVWKFASYLFRHKFKPSVKEWLCQYTLGKCLWKMYQSPENINQRQPVTLEDVLEAFSDSIDLVPKKEKSTEYILEPHYKLASVVHKLVRMKKLEPKKAIEYLQATQFARGASQSEDEQGQTEWEPYILDVLQRIGRADKSNWHHRITARAAHVIYDDDPHHSAALGAKHQFMLQIFTKTMTMQVWKPEYERPGRHYVYTSRYLHFFVRILDQLGDRENMEQLVRRIRRKTTDFLDHPKIWEYTATAYLRLMRRKANVPDGQERIVFDKVSYEDFTKFSEKVEQWAHQSDNDSIYLKTIRDAIELKKLNNSLMKGPAIDDLIGDTYAAMYDEVVSSLPREEPIVQAEPLPPQSTVVSVAADVAPVPDDYLNRMRLNNLLSAQTDGILEPSTNATATSGIPTSARATPPADPPRVSTPSKPGRVKTITRREVQRKAEAASNRPQPVKTPTLAKKITVEIPLLRRAASDTNEAIDSDDEKLDDGADAPDGLDSALPSRRPSAAASLGDQKNEDSPDDRDNEADDESELSDADVEEATNDRRKAKIRDDNVDGDSGEIDDAGSDGDQEDNDDTEDEDPNNEDNDEDEEVERDVESEGEAADEPEPEQEVEAEDVMDVDVDNDDEDDDVVEMQDSQEINDAAAT